MPAPVLSLPRKLIAVLSGLLLAGCATLPPDAARALPADALLLGEQHDAPAHQRLHRDTVHELARRGQLAALALEMADRGVSTAGLPPQADEAAVQRALGWSDRAWPWAAYAPAVMAAVRAGVPVLGANLPRQEMAATMNDESLAPMARIQIARDLAMATTVSEAVRPGRTVVLLAGSGHVDEALGVPQHLPPTLKARAVTWPTAPAQRDYCAQLRQQMGR